jgi:hypothetical protein
MTLGSDLKTGKGDVFPLQSAVEGTADMSAAKLDAVTELLAKLKADLSEHNLTPDSKARAVRHRYTTSLTRELQSALRY